MRVENVKGAVWTVDEMEFYKRRPQRNEKGSNGQGYVSGQIGRLPTVHSCPIWHLSLYSDDDFGGMWPDGSSDLIQSPVITPKRPVGRGRPKRNLSNK